MEELLLQNGNQMSVFEELYRECLDHRVLVINDNITDDLIDEHIMYILKWNLEDKDIPVDKRKPIKLYISSPGGNGFVSNILQDVIEQSKTPVIGVGLDMVASAAYYILLACDERIVFKNTALLQHEGDIEVGNSSRKAADTMAFFDTMENKTKEFVLAHTNMTSEFYDEIHVREYWMYPERAKELGVIDKIVGVDCDIDYIL